MKRLLVFAAVVSLSQGEHNVASLESILSKVMDVAKDLSGTIAERIEYMGCYLDNASRMINSKSRLKFNELTHEWCFAYCREGNYRYAAVQYSTACFCGDTINTNTYPKKPESDCTMKCSGNSKQICGGPYRNSLYRLY